MKLLCIVADITPDDFGGAEYNFVEILRRLAPKFENVVLVLGPGNQVKKEFAGMSNIDYRTVSYPHLTGLYGLMYILFATPVAIWVCLRQKPDFIWAKQEFPQGVVSAIVSRLFKIKIGVTTQSARLNKDELVIKLPLPEEFKELFSDLITPLISFSFRTADVVFAVSKFAANRATDLGAKKTVIIPNGVNLKLFRSSPNKFPTKKFRVITTSSLIYRNAIDVILKACAKLPKKLDWELTIAGNGPLESDLKKLAAGLGINNRVKFLGYLPNSRVPSLLSKTSVFVRPSRAEGFGSSFLEAMSAGVPVIATPVGGIVDFLTDKQTGLLVPVDDSQALADSILKISRDKELTSRLVKNAKKLVREKYTWDNIAGEFFRQLEHTI